MKTGAYRDEIGKCKTERRMNYIKTSLALSGDLGLNQLTGRPKFTEIGRKDRCRRIHSSWMVRT